MSSENGVLLFEKSPLSKRQGSLTRLKKIGLKNLKELKRGKNKLWMKNLEKRRGRSQIDIETLPVCSLRKKTSISIKDMDSRNARKDSNSTSKLEKRQEHCLLRNRYHTNSSNLHPTPKYEIDGEKERTTSNDIAIVRRKERKNRDIVHKDVIDIFLSAHDLATAKNEELTNGYFPKFMNNRRNYSRIRIKSPSNLNSKYVTNTTDAKPYRIIPSYVRNPVKRIQRGKFGNFYNHRQINQNKVKEIPYYPKLVKSPKHKHDSDFDYEDLDISNLNDSSANKEDQENVNRINIKANEKHGLRLKKKMDRELVQIFKTKIINHPFNQMPFPF